jgi:hypothetical protein
MFITVFGLLAISVNMAYTVWPVKLDVFGRWGFVPFFAFLQGVSFFTAMTIQTPARRAWMRSCQPKKGRWMLIWPILLATTLCSAKYVQNYYQVIAAAELKAAKEKQYLDYLSKKSATDLFAISRSNILKSNASIGSVNNAKNENENEANISLINPTIPTTINIVEESHLPPPYLNFGKNWTWESTEVGCNDTYSNAYTDYNDSHSNNLSAFPSSAVRAAVDLALNWTVEGLPSWKANISKIINPTLLFAPSDPNNTSSIVMVIP